MIKVFANPYAVSPFLCPELWVSWQHPFGSYVESSIHDKYTIIQFKEGNIMKTQSSTYKLKALLT